MVKNEILSIISPSHPGTAVRSDNGRWYGRRNDPTPGSSSSQPFFSSFAIIIPPGGILVLYRSAWRMTRSL
jgi:hypothetical protein